MFFPRSTKIMNCFLKYSLFKPSKNYFSTVNFAKFKLPEYKYYKLDTILPSETECTREDALNYLESMNRIRQMETRIKTMYQDKEIRGFCHTYNGEEAVIVGIEAGLASGDLMIGSFRCHAHTLMHGGNVTAILSELTGRASGISQAKGGSCHLYTDTFFGGNGIVGAQVPLGVGLALKLKYQDEKNISVVLYGDGASNQGQVFEAFNIAKLWNLPVLFVCENNKVGMTTEAYRSSASTDFYKRGDFIPGIWADGMDVLGMRQATEFAREWCLSGRGPLILEAQTYRYHGHNVMESGKTYRTQEEVQLMFKKHDPITHFVSQTVSAGLITESEAKAIENRMAEEIDQIHAKVMKEPGPELSEAYTHIYISPPTGFKIRGREPKEFIVPRDA